MKAIRIEVYGRVQGVYFRAHTQTKARELGINGTVQNARDGSVMIFAEGQENSLQKLIEWCKKGPILASVTKVEVHECAVNGYSSFEIIK